MWGGGDGSQVMEQGGFAAAPGTDDSCILQGRALQQIKQPFEYPFPAEKVTGLLDRRAGDEGEG